MPHLRHRHLESLLKKTTKHSVITGVFGHRQVGKTTLIQKLSQTYKSLDLAENLALAESDPNRFLELHQGSPLSIDECQHAPSLFPALKEWARVHPKPGQLILSGSVRFTSRKAIRESLTGRMIAWELLPMDLSEAHQAKLPDSLIRVLDKKSLELPLPSSVYATVKAVESYALTGGLPGVMFLRDASIREQKLETQINTILERDLKLLIQTPLNYRTLKALLSRLARRVGAPLDWASLSRDVRISVPTLKKLIDAFESMYLIRVLPTEGSRQKPVVFFEDAGEARYLAEHFDNPLSPLLSTLFSNLRPQIAYRPELGIRMYHYQTRGGASVPMCFKKGASHLGIIPLLDAAPSKSELGSARSFLKNVPNGKVLLIHNGQKDFMVDEKIRIIGASQIL